MKSATYFEFWFSLASICLPLCHLNKLLAQFSIQNYCLPLKRLSGSGLEKKTNDSCNFNQNQIFIKITFIVSKYFKCLSGLLWTRSENFQWEFVQKWIHLRLCPCVCNIQEYIFCSNQNTANIFSFAYYAVCSMQFAVCTAYFELFSVQW